MQLAEPQPSPAVAPPAERTPFFGLTADALAARLAGAGWPRFRAGQVLQWVYGKNVTDPAHMTNLAKRDRDALGELFVFRTAELTRDVVSTDSTRKLLLTWPNGSQAETVMIPDADRRTACVSSQVGCPVGCRFCASGMNGVKGNLVAAQIVEQIVTFNALLATAPTAERPGLGGGVGKPERITNVVFMGMGEPTANYANVMQAIRVLHDPKGLNMGARRITVSTVGVPQRIRDLANEELPLNLALSLHAPNEPLRRQLIPWAEHFSIDDILDACRYYFDKTGREITLEYILLAGVNDRPQHARELAEVCRTLRANVNLIRYNEVPDLPFRRPASADVVAFQDILRDNGVNAHVRKSRGRDIDAACGQLRRKQQEAAVVSLGGASRAHSDER